MSIESSSFEENEWSRTFLDLSSKMTEPFCAIWHGLRYRLVAPLDPKKFENRETTVQEIAVRALIGLGSVLGALAIFMAPAPMICSIATLGLGSKALRAIGFALQKKGYTHIRGKAAEKVLDSVDPKVRLMTWNVCGVGGGMSLDHGGVPHWRFRLDRIVQKIKEEDPDVLVLEEIYDTALAEALVEKLQSEYAHFFTHLGENVWGSIGGCMVISKCAVHNFSNTSFDNNTWGLNRSFAILELKARPEDALPSARIIGIHLIQGDNPEDREKRIHQVAQIVSHVAKQTLSMPTVMMGDFNAERDAEEGKAVAAYMDYGYLGAEPTCTNRLIAQWDSKPRAVWEETIDNIAVLKNRLPSGTPIPAIQENGILENGRLIKAFDSSFNTKNALSDHHGVSAELRGLSLAKWVDPG